MSLEKGILGAEGAHSCGSDAANTHLWPLLQLEGWVDEKRALCPLNRLSGRGSGARSPGELGRPCFADYIPCDVLTHHPPVLHGCRMGVPSEGPRRLGHVTGRREPAGRVFIGWNSCKIRDHVETTRCFKCQGFGHIARHCKVRLEICGHCGEEGHPFAKCGRIAEAAVCSNCKRAGLPHNHGTRDRNCPKYKAARESAASKSNYG
ncbi:hypothetical protein KM043_018808 [Ampulex compressa]|nr:hypothetical protein KM043_018808 [Ampulex compressa]